LKKFAIFLTAMVFLFAEDSMELQLFEKLFSKLFNKKTVFVYTKPKYSKIFEDSKVIKLTKSCKKADLQFGVYDKNCTKPAFVLDYYIYKKHPDILGAFYWRKGRPQLRLRKKVIKKYNLHISKDFEDFLE
jgi:hypothetical protein